MYFAITVGDEAYQNLTDFFRLDGLAYKVVPVKTSSREGERGFVDSDVLYSSVMEKFAWGGINNPAVYLDENNLRMLANVKSVFSRLAETLIKERKIDKAKEVLERCYSVMPLTLVAPSFYDLSIADLYYKTGDENRAHEILETLLTQTKDELSFFESLDEEDVHRIEGDYYRSAAMGHETARIAKDNNDDNFKKRASNEILEIMSKDPLLKNLTMQTIETQDFMRLYQTMTDFQKQMISIYIGLMDYLE
jgi:tetratricopeptide (TPR) repeat protein